MRPRRSSANCDRGPIQCQRAHARKTNAFGPASPSHQKKSLPKRLKKRSGVIHERHYTLEEASALLPHVVELVNQMRAARDRLGDREAREALSEAGPTNGGGDPGRTVSEGFLQLRASRMGLRELEVVLRDLDRGRLDFPSLRAGREVYLCWHEGEDAIGFWQAPDAGFGGRRPLADG